MTLTALKGRCPRCGNDPTQFSPEGASGSTDESGTAPPKIAIPAGWSFERHSNGAYLVRQPDGTAVYAHPRDDSMSLAGNALGLLAQQIVESQEAAAREATMTPAAATCEEARSKDGWLRNFPPTTYSGPLWCRLIALANVLSDCGRLVSHSGNAEAVMRGAAAALRDALSDSKASDHVGDTNFEGWLGLHSSHDSRGSQLPSYIKQDMRDAYWGGYCERAALGRLVERQAALGEVSAESGSELDGRRWFKVFALSALPPSGTVLYDGRSTEMLDEDAHQAARYRMLMEDLRMPTKVVGPWTWLTPEEMSEACDKARERWTGELQPKRVLLALAGKAEDAQLLARARDLAEACEREQRPEQGRKWDDLEHWLQQHFIEKAKLPELGGEAHVNA